MPHASYVAKPGIDPDRWPDYEPPGDWDIDWPFPGPSPPGYDPEDPRYGCTVSGDGEVEVDDTYTATFRLHEIHAGTTWRTENPNVDSSITWTATLDGENLLMSIDGSGYAYSIDTSYEHVGLGWYGDAPVITFDIIGDDNGKTIVLLANSNGTVGGGSSPTSFSVSAEKEITVTAVVSFELSMTVNSFTNTMSDPSSSYGFDIVTTVTSPAGYGGGLGRTLLGSGANTWYFPIGSPDDFNYIGSAVSIVISPEFEIDEEGNYTILLSERVSSLDLYPGDTCPTANVTLTMTVRLAGEIVYSYSYTHDTVAAEVTTNYTFVVDYETGETVLTIT